jgi:hypothetical protein
MLVRERRLTLAGLVKSGSYLPLTGNRSELVAKALGKSGMNLPFFWRNGSFVPLGWQFLALT